MSLQDEGMFAKVTVGWTGLALCPDSEAYSRLKEFRSLKTINFNSLKARKNNARYRGGGGPWHELVVIGAGIFSFTSQYSLVRAGGTESFWLLSSRNSSDTLPLDGFPTLPILPVHAPIVTPVMARVPFIGRLFWYVRRFLRYTGRSLTKYDILQARVPGPLWISCIDFPRSLRSNHYSWTTYACEPGSAC